MKENPTQTLLIVIAALVAGFLIGFSINNLPHTVMIWLAQSW